MPTTVFFISLGNSWTQLKPLFNWTKAITFLGPKIWILVPLKIKWKESVNTFENVVMTWILLIVRVDCASVTLSMFYNSFKNCYYNFQYPAVFPICTNFSYFIILHKKWTFPLMILLVNWRNPTEEILNENLHLLCNGTSSFLHCNFICSFRSHLVSSIFMYVTTIKKLDNVIF